MDQISTPRGRRIIEEISSWPGVTVDDGELGELSFQVGGREFGHLHGDPLPDNWAAHFSFPRSTWTDLYEEGRITHHPVFPDATQGPAARVIRDEGDVDDVIALFRLNYDRLADRAHRGRSVA
jgi:hypothetical protein